MLDEYSGSRRRAARWEKCSGWQWRCGQNIHSLAGSDFIISKSLSYLSKIEGGFECGRVIDGSGARKMIGDDLLRCTTAVIEKLMERHKNNTSCKNSGARKSLLKY